MPGCNDVVASRAAQRPLLEDSLCFGHIMMIVVLFVRVDSIYKTMSGVDCYDEARDARTWPGGCPVVAHPPCRAWSALAHLAKPAPGEMDLARFAVRVVRENGGVLEHPASSRLWRDQTLPDPGAGKDAAGGWTMTVPQWWWGHRADKPTRFYICGCDPRDVPDVPFCLGDAPSVVTTSKRKCETPPSEWRERLGNREREATPERLAAWLVELARRCSKHNAEGQGCRALRHTMDPLVGASGSPNPG